MNLQGLRNNLLVLLCIVCSCTGTAVFAAADTDKSLPVDYKNDGNLSMKNEGTSRIVTIVDNVVITQGSMKITGDTARLEYALSNSVLIKVTINGSPATYEQQTNESEEIVEGSSDVIHYYTAETIVEFVGNANLRQQASSTNCAAIKYYAESELFDSTGPCSGTLSGSQSN